MLMGFCTFSTRIWSHFEKYRQNAGIIILTNKNRRKTHQSAMAS